MDKESVYRLVQAGDADTIASAASVLDSAELASQSSCRLLESFAH